MKTAASQYPWAEELEKTVVHSLATSFGLDFLLFKDKSGGEVDTINNVRQGVWATEQEKLRYAQRGDYNSDLYHTHENYIARGQQDKPQQKAGTLHDPYRKVTMGVDEQRNTDHVIGAKEVHDDAGRVLAELDGVELANQSSNLQSTHETINKSKGKDSIDVFLARLPEQIAKDEIQLTKDRNKLAGMPRNTPEEQHKARELEDKIRKSEEKISTLKSADPAGMREVDKRARKSYNQQINQKYYASSKFWKQSASASAVAGLKMGTRQMLGLIMAEAWFELREQIPRMLEKLKVDFSLEVFMASVQQTLREIWERIKLRFNDFLITFKDGVFAGILSSATTTLFNVFATTQKMAIKIIRELWGSIVKAIKLLLFNPENLSFVNLCKAVTAVLSIGTATVVGTMIYAQLLPLCNFPFGGELASFASALVTGLVTLGLNYFLLYSKFADNLWLFVESLKPHAGVVRKFREINAELDRYLIELGRIEFGLDADELEDFAAQLTACNDEIERNELLGKEVARRNIELPYEMGNSASTRKWLSSLIS